MKKIMAVLGILSCMTFLPACGRADQNSTAVGGKAEPETVEKTAEEAMGETVTEQTETVKKPLVAYFSWADNAVIEGEVDAVASPSVTAPGNVAQLASWVSERTGGNLFSIQVTEPYSSDWDECLERANQERSESARPKLKESVENIKDYDVVFLGFPNWWYGSPMAVLSFLEENDLSGKQIYLFCSHGTGGLAGTVDDIKEILPENAVLSENVFDVNEEDAASSENDITGWLEELGF